MFTRENCDLLIIGGGPAGLSAATNAASEGLKTIVIDSSERLGGQIRDSSCVKNYPGFPHGISGKSLVASYIDQAMTFGARIISPMTAIGIRDLGERRLVTTKGDKCLFEASAVLLSTGLSYKRLAVPGISNYEGRGVSYGATTENPASLGECTVCIVGGANSAGQAAVHYAQNSRIRIKMLIRSTLKENMSEYLINEIKALSNIDILEGAEITELHGTESLQSVSFRQRTSVKEQVVYVDDAIKATHLCIFIGASPKTQWLNKVLELDSYGFIMTTLDVTVGNNWHFVGSERLKYATSMQGVFAIGDVRYGATRRVASVVGEGSAVMPNIHRFLHAKPRLAA